MPAAVLSMAAVDRLRREALVAALAEAVRERNGEGELASVADLQQALQAAWRQAGEGDGEPPALAGLLPAVAEAQPDLQIIEGPQGEVYYYLASQMSRTYAEIVARRGAPHLQIAAEVRRNSRDYPRSIPLDIFEYPPFSMTAEQVQQALRFLAENPEFADITYTTSSVGTVYLFSTDYIDRNYGEFLAEHADVIRATSP